ncbi:uncharacterized protein BCR38DRAFT_470784 [Pseudomassariella vexata]|uniref:Major facilitator superfamily domain-containing protein n=1 Tax=Pseudomassariella vexata TaxID=1141098 RepID=A0A1Y2EK63_9PEZI|nr:uncharacterized protein BCR38DRAFT_470784 [Pseudomassariella vexata]ORY71941.1 hypothetical protein BCR38DRAFT_470784 [Pseudomassariella vexata]
MLVLSFRGAMPVRLVWFDLIGLLLGGGNPIMVALLLAMLADAATEEKSVCGNLLAPSLSALMMERMGPWSPVWVGVGLRDASVISIITDTARTPQEPEEQQPSDQNLHLYHLAHLPRNLLLHGPIHLQAIQRTFIPKRICPVRLQCRPGDPIPQASCLGSPKPSCKAPLPLTSARPMIPGFVFGLGLLALGSDVSSLTRSLMSLYIDPVHRFHLFGLVGMVDLVGTIYAQLLLAGLFSLGMKLEGGWIGLQYCGLTLLIAVTTALLPLEKVPEEAEDPAPENGNHEDWAWYD